MLYSNFKTQLFVSKYELIYGILCVFIATYIGKKMNIHFYYFSLELC